jgi:hypothetical protein
MRGTGTPANSAYLAVNSAKRDRPSRRIPSGPNRGGDIVGLLWIAAKIAALSRKFSRRRKAIFNVENAKTSANQILISFYVIKITRMEAATVNNNYRWVSLTVGGDKSSPS